MSKRTVAMADSQPVKGDWSHLRVLVVDDESFTMDLVLTALSKLNIARVREAADGDSAIDVFRSNPDIGLIVSDWNMPGMDGYTFLRAVRQIKPDVPFFMLTGNVTQSHVQKALEAGVDGYLAKPFRPRDLQQKIHRILTQRYGEAGTPSPAKRAFGVER